MRHALLFILTLCFAQACELKSDGLERLEELYPTPKPKDPNAYEPDELGVPECNGLSGTWAVRLVQPATVAPLGEPWDMMVVDLFLAQRSSNGDDMQLRFCNQDVTLRANGQPQTLGVPATPDAFKATMYNTPLNVPLPGDGSFHAGPMAWLWGLQNLNDPINDTLPDITTWEGDGRVWDQDNDEHPGVTVHVPSLNGDRYLVRRVVFTFGTGKLALTNLWLTGPLTSHIEEKAIGASNQLLTTVAPITNLDGAVYQFRCVGRTYSCASHQKDHSYVFKDAPQ